jgi:hypothetical protein
MNEQAPARTARDDATGCAHYLFGARAGDDWKRFDAGADDFLVMHKDVAAPRQNPMLVLTEFCIDDRALSVLFNRLPRASILSAHGLCDSAGEAAYCSTARAGIGGRSFICQARLNANHPSWVQIATTSFRRPRS